MTAGPAQVVYEFGPFRLEVGEHRLVRGDRPIPLTGKAFSTLCVLVERNGSLISKQDLLSAVWPETAVEENNLDRNISTLRKALGEQSNGESFIETVPRVGYRFVAPVSVSQPKLQPAPAGLVSETPSRQEIRFCVTADKVRLAYSTIGSGLPLVKVANCFNHLDFEWESPIWRHWVRDLTQETQPCAVRRTR
jgi:DNA-binding winged helix-turn-helix (wHTH) protein